MWLKEYENPHYWDTRTPKWQGLPRFANLYMDLNANKIRSFLRRQLGEVLDIGCGDGGFLAYANVGIDFSKGMLQKARRRYDGKDLVLASALYLPFQDGTFDFAFMVSVLLHIHSSKRRKAKREAFRVAKEFCNIDDYAHKITVFPRLYLRLKRLGLKPNILVAFLSLPVSFLVDRLKRWTP